MRRAASTAFALLVAACGVDVRLGGGADDASPPVTDSGADDDGATDGSATDGIFDAPSDDATIDAPAIDAGCGKDCLGGACVQGQCQPVLLADNLGGPFWIAVDATTVYWTERGRNAPTPNVVQRVAKDGTGLVPLASENATFGAVAVDATNVYWSAQALSGTAKIVVEASPVGAAPAVTTVSHLLGSFVPAGVTLDGTNVYFGTGTEILGAPKGSADVPASDVLGGLVSVGGVASDGVTIFAAAPAGVRTTPSTIPAFAGGGTPLPGSPASVVDVALSGGRVFGAGGSTVWSLPQSGGTPLLYSTTESGPIGVTADAQRVYWTTTSDVRSAPVTGGAVTIIATGYAGLAHVASDATAIYYADYGGNRVWKLAK
jgi:hypothetical protein